MLHRDTNVHALNIAALLIQASQRLLTCNTLQDIQEAYEDVRRAQQLMESNLNARVVKMREQSRKKV